MIDDILDADGEALGAASYEAFEFSIINLGGSNTITLQTTSGVTSFGNMTVSKSSSGRFQIINKSHKTFYKKIIDYYKDNSDKIIDTIAKLKTATDQTIINFLLVENNIDVKILPDCYNLVDLYRKNLLYLDSNHWWTDELHFLEAGWVYHFNAIPANMGDVTYWMDFTYNKLYENK